MLRALLLLSLLAGCGSAGGFQDDDGPRDTGVEDNGEGGGDFQERVIDDGIVHGQGAQIIDIDGDGNQDVLAALSLTDAVHLYLNEGGGDSWQRVEIGTGIVAMETEVADFDDDGDLDIAAVELFDRNDGIGRVTWYENSGDVRGGWTERPITDIAGPIYISSGDLDGDGAIDLVFGSSTYDEGRGVWMLRNLGNSFDAPAVIDADVQEVRSVQVADMDGDGTSDVVVAARDSYEIAWYQRTGSAFTKNLIATADLPTDIRVANLDGDPELEVVASTAGKLDYFDPPTWTPSTIAIFAAALDSRIAVADFDGDGSTDVAAGTSLLDGELRIYLNEGGGNFASELVQSGYAGLNHVAGGDLDGDGRTDLLTTTYSHTESNDLISWWANGR
jgi:hypothetical protein